MSPVFVGGFWNAIAPEESDFEILDEFAAFLYYEKYFGRHRTF
ncbi:MAG: hypothetical protein WAO83_05880 [Fuerstiella sp.]